MFFRMYVCVWRSGGVSLSVVEDEDVCLLYVYVWRSEWGRVVCGVCVCVEDEDVLYGVYGGVEGAVFVVVVVDCSSSCWILLFLPYTPLSLFGFLSSMPMWCLSYRSVSISCGLNSSMRVCTGLVV